MHFLNKFTFFKFILVISFFSHSIASATCNVLKVDLSLDQPSNNELYNQFVSGVHFDWWQKSWNERIPLAQQRLNLPAGDDLRFNSLSGQVEIRNFLNRNPTKEQIFHFFSQADVRSYLHPRVLQAMEDLKKFDLANMERAKISVIDAYKEILGFKKAGDWHEKVMKRAVLPSYDNVVEAAYPIEDLLTNYAAHIPIPEELAKQLVKNAELLRLLHSFEHEYNGIDNLPDGMKEKLQFVVKIFEFVKSEFTRVKIPDSFLKFPGWENADSKKLFEHYGKTNFWRTAGSNHVGHADRRQTPPWQIWPHYKEGHFRSVLIFPAGLPTTLAVPRNPDGTFANFWVTAPKDRPYITVFYAQETPHSAVRPYSEGDQKARTFSSMRTVFIGAPQITR